MNSVEPQQYRENAMARNLCDELEFRSFRKLITMSFGDFGLDVEMKNGYVQKVCEMVSNSTKTLKSIGFNPSVMNLKHFIIAYMIIDNNKKNNKAMLRKLLKKIETKSESCNFVRIRIVKYMSFILKYNLHNPKS